VENSEITCSSLVITTNNSGLPEGQFHIYFGDRATRATFGKNRKKKKKYSVLKLAMCDLSLGPLGLTNPSGGHLLPLSPASNEAQLTYRPEVMEQVQFRVCGNGTVPDFLVSPPSRHQCKQGSSAGGFLFPFDVIVTYTGDFPIPEENYTITSSDKCTAQDTGVSFTFIIPSKMIHIKMSCCCISACVFTEVSW